MSRPRTQRRQAVKAGWLIQAAADAPAPRARRQRAKAVAVAPRQPREVPWFLIGALGVLVAIAATIALLVAQTPAAPVAKPDFPAVDGIPCDAGERTAVHYHVHLAIYSGGQPVQVPYAIGIGSPQPPTGTADDPVVTDGGCFYWLHTHANDGIVHIEAPTATAFNLGQFFDIWGNPLSSLSAADARGPVVAYVDGSLYHGDPRSIPLTAHEVVQLDVGSSEPAPQPYAFPDGA